MSEENKHTYILIDNKWAHLDKPVKCNECSYNNGCRDCALFETEYCSHELKESHIYGTR